MTCPDFEIANCTFSLSFPLGGEVLVRENDEVSKGELLATKEEEEFQELDLSGRLLAASLGSKIEKDQTLAFKKTFLGKRVEFKSPVSGILVDVSKQGILKIKTKSEKKEIRSPFKAKVKEAGRDFLVLEFKGLKIEGSWGKGPKVLGTLKLYGEREKEVKLQDLGPEQVGKILVFAGKISLGVCHKAEALGIKGLVGGSISQELGPNELTIVTIGGKDEFIPKEVWLELEEKDGEEAIISGEEKYLCFPT
ncbi:MAG: hypothetical protein ACOZBZ_03060 [Patescibacteria group bacterium]